MYIYLFLDIVVGHLRSIKSSSSERLTYPLRPFQVCRLNALFQPERLVQSDIILFRVVSWSKSPFREQFVMFFAARQGVTFCFFTADLKRCRRPDNASQKSDSNHTTFEQDNERKPLFRRPLFVTFYLTKLKGTEGKNSPAFGFCRPIARVACFCIEI